jgi:hypothetical protein
MNQKPVAPSVIEDVRHLAQALYQDRIEIRQEHQNEPHNTFLPQQRWAEIGGIANQRAAAILKDFLDEFAAMTAERDRLKSTLRHIAETAIKVGDV